MSAQIVAVSISKVGLLLPLSVKPTVTSISPVEKVKPPERSSPSAPRVSQVSASATDVAPLLSPWITSLPPPATTVSFPPPAVTVSAPAPLAIESSPAPLLMSSLASGLPIWSPSLSV